MEPIAKSVRDVAILDLSKNTTLGDCASLWTMHFGKIDVRELKLKGCNLTVGDMEPIAKLVSGVAILDLSKNTTLGGCATFWALHLTEMYHLKKLKLKGCNLTDVNIKPIAKSVNDMVNLNNDMVNLDHLNLSKNTILGGCASLWALHLKEMYHLKELKLKGCNLTDVDMKPIAESVRDVAILDLSKNTTLGGCASLWALHLTEMQHLKKLKLKGCNLTDVDVEPIAKSVNDMPKLVHLNLSGNDAFGGQASSWALHLRSLLYLKELKLKGCNLTVGDMEPIAESVKRLAILDLSKNTTLGGYASFWTMHFWKMHHIRELKLKGCNLTVGDMKPIAMLVSGVAILDLSKNTTLGGCASFCTLHLRKMHQVRELTLKGCNLTDNNMKPIAESVSDMPTLVHLDLSENTALSGCASSWAPHLKQMTKHLKQLKMYQCFLTDEDNEHITASIGLNSPILKT